MFPGNELNFSGDSFSGHLDKISITYPERPAFFYLYWQPDEIFVTHCLFTGVI